MIRDDEEAVYRLLTEGIPEFMELGEVAVSDEMKRMRVAPPPEVSVGVSYTGNWLELKVDAEGMSRQELLKILPAKKEVLPAKERGISGADGRRAFDGGQDDGRPGAF